MQIRRFKGKIWAAWQILRSRMNPGFSQAGEDKIMHYLLSHYLGIHHPTYLDIGANHPILFNNTYLFYMRGGHGICIEPDPKFHKLLKRFRKRDVILQAGIGTGGSGSAEFYVFPGKEAAWNSFSQSEAIKRQSESGIPFTIMQQDLLDINETIATHLGEAPDILSVDAEGIDFEIIKSLDFERYKPKVICVESVGFTMSAQPKRHVEMLDYISKQGYFIFADTHINTIFCRVDLFKKQDS